MFFLRGFRCRLFKAKRSISVHRVREKNLWYPGYVGNEFSFVGGRNFFMLAPFFVLLVQEFLTPPNHELLLVVLQVENGREFVYEFSF